MERFQTPEKVTTSQDYHEHPFDLWAKARQSHTPNRVLLTQFPHLAYTGSTFQPIRVYLDLSHLSSDAGRMCKTTGDTYHDGMEKKTYRCGVDDVATNSKLVFLRETLIPAAKQHFLRALRVQPVQGSIILATGYMGNKECMDVKIPTKHTTTGAGSYDYVLYVTARPTQGNTIAWAGACQWDQHGRPVAGQANFGPNQITVTRDPS